MARSEQTSGFIMRKESALDMLLIEGYGSGGFKFKDRRIKGHVLVLENGFYPVDVDAPSSLSLEHIQRVLVEKDLPELILFGMGARNSLLPRVLQDALQAHQIGFDVMDTGAAARTYNVLRLEGRRVAALLFAVN